MSPWLGMHPQIYCQLRVWHGIETGVGALAEGKHPKKAEVEKAAKQAHQNIIRVQQ
jgi:hypothetical protein